MANCKTTTSVKCPDTTTELRLDTPDQGIEVESLTFEGKGLVLVKISDVREENYVYDDALVSVDISNCPNLTNLQAVRLITDVENQDGVTKEVKTPNESFTTIYVSSEQKAKIDANTLTIEKMMRSIS